MKKILLILLVALPLVAQPQETASRRAVGTCGFVGSFDIGAFSDWGKNKEKLDGGEGYGGEFGAFYKWTWPSKWFLQTEATFAIDQYRFNVPDQSEKARLTRYGISDRWEGGYTFAGNRLGIAPTVGVEFSTSLKDKIHNVSSERRKELEDCWRQGNIALGFGVNLTRGNFGVSLMGYFGLLNLKENSAPDYLGKCYYGNKFIVSLKYTID